MVFGRRKESKAKIRQDKKREKKRKNEIKFTMVFGISVSGYITLTIAIVPGPLNTEAVIKWVGDMPIEI